LTGRSMRTLLYGGIEPIRDHVVSVECTRQASVALRTPAAGMIVPIVRDSGGRPVPDVYGGPRRPNPEYFGPVEASSAVDDLQTELNRWAVAQGYADATSVLDRCVLGLPHSAHVQRLADRRGRSR
jgi:hypothetical protein